MALSSSLWLYLANIQVSICRTTGPLVYGYVKNEQAIMKTPIQENAEYNLLAFIASGLRVTGEELLSKIAQYGPEECLIAFKGFFLFSVLPCYRHLIKTAHITQTCLCNMQLFLKYVKMIIFR